MVFLNGLTLEALCYMHLNFAWLSACPINFKNHAVMIGNYCYACIVKQIRRKKPPHLSLQLKVISLDYLSLTSTMGVMLGMLVICRGRLLH